MKTIIIFISILIFIINGCVDNSLSINETESKFLILLDEDPEQQRVMTVVDNQ